MMIADCTRQVGAIATHYHFDHTGGAIPPPFVAMVYGPFGAPKGEAPTLPGLREMRTEHGCRYVYGS